MSSFLLAGGVALTLALPHLLPLGRASPPVAVAVWLGALGLRALAGVATALLVARDLPESAPLSRLTHWCWQAVVPLFPARLGLSGHALAHAAASLPGALVAVSVASALWALWRAASAVRRLLRRRILGAGPMGSLIVGGAGVQIIAVGLARPNVIVSAGALVHLDDGELAAGLAHERGHIARRHRFALVWGQLCRALGLLIPGGRRALAELAFHLERDADAYAIAQAHQRRALAGALCKAATSDLSHGRLHSLAARRAIAARIRVLLGADPPRRTEQGSAAAIRTAAAVCVVLALAAVVPQLAAASGRGPHPPALGHRCSG